MSENNINPECESLLAELTALPLGKRWSPDLTERIRAHCALCATCRDQLLAAFVEAEAMREVIDELRSPASRDATRKEIRKRIAPVMAKRRRAHARSAGVDIKRRRTIGWWAFGALAAAASVALLLLWPDVPSPTPAVKIVAFKREQYDPWQEFRWQRSIPADSFVQIESMPVENRYLLVFDGTDSPGILKLEALAQEGWEIELRGPRVASFLVLDVPESLDEEQRNELVSELEGEVKEILTGHELVEGTRLAWADEQSWLERDEVTIRGPNDPARTAQKPEWASKLEEVLKEKGVKFDGWSYAIDDSSP